MAIIIELAKVIRQYAKDNNVIKVFMDDTEYFFIRCQQKVNIQVIDQTSRACKNGWWLLPNDEVYAYEGH